MFSTDDYGAVAQQSAFAKIFGKSTVRERPAEGAADLRPQLSPDEVKIRDIDAALPVLMDELAAGKTHRFKGLAPRRLIAAVTAEDARRGLKSTYFTSPEQLAHFVTDIQSQIKEREGQEVVVTGALMVSKQCHHAAIVGLIKKRQAAIMVLDSIPDLHLLQRNIKNPLKRARRAALNTAGGYDQATFRAFRNTPNTSVYYTYLGTQAGITDCAAFTIASTRHMLTDPNEIPHYYGILNRRDAHVTADASAPPGLQRVVITPNEHKTGANTNFVLSGEEFIAPLHYLHTQSKKRLERYCAVSPFVKDDARWKNFLLDQHRQHRRTIQPLFRFFPRIHALKANISIRQEQIHALLETREALRTRLAQTGPPA